MSYESVGQGLVVAFRVCCVLCVAVGVFLSWLIPVLWALLKPVLHGVTA